jgi:hypothetical protein
MKINNKLSLPLKEADKNYVKFSTSLNTVLKLHKNKIIKGFLGQGYKPAPNTNALMLYNTKSVVYSFRKVNNIYPLLTKTEYLLNSVFRSMFSLISKPIYLIRHDKIIIRLFVYFSPKIDKYLDTSTTGINYYTSTKHNVEANNSRAKTVKTSTNLAPQAGFLANVSGFKLRHFFKFKSLRPNAIEILKSQIKIKSNSSISRLNPLLYLSAPSLFLTASNKGEAALPKVKPCEGKRGISESNYINKYPYSSIVSNFKNNLEKLSFIFSKLFNKKVEFEIIKAQLPFQDSNVLSQILGYNANKYKFRQMLKILIPRAVIKNPSKNLLARDKQSVEYKNIESSVYGTSPFPLPPLGRERTASHYQGQGGDGLFTNLLPISSSYLSCNNGQSRFNLYLAALTDTVNASPRFDPSLTGQGKDGIEVLKQKLTTHDMQSPKEECISYLSGMNIKLAGRLMTQSMRPRFTVQSLQEGSLARVKVHYIENSRFTGKNKRGAFSFTITISHVFN